MYYSIYQKPSSSMVTDYSDYIKFNSKANVKTNHCNAAINITNTEQSLLVLENNVTLSVTKNFYAELGSYYEGIFKRDGELHIAGNNTAKTISVTAKFTKNVVNLVDTAAIRVYSTLTIYGPEFLYTIKATANNSANSRAAGIFAYGLISAAVISKAITVQAKSTDYGGQSVTYAIQIFGDTDFRAGITGNIQSKATSAKGEAKAYGIDVDGDLTLQKQLASKINVSASGNILLEGSLTEAAGIQINGTAKIYNISKSITVSAKDTGKVSSHAIDATDGAVFIYGKNTAAVSVSAVSKKDLASAFGIQSDGLLISAWNGNFTISAKGNSAEAALFYSEYEGSSFFNQLAGKFNVTATAANSTATAIGFFSRNGSRFGDLTKVKLTVKATSSKDSAFACGIYSSEAGFSLLNGTARNIGTITVSASGSKTQESTAYGIYLPKGIIMSDNNSSLGLPLEGTIKVTAANGIAYGVVAQTVDVSSALNINAKGSSASCAYMLGGTLESQLHIYKATVKAEVSNKKNKDNAYAVFCSEGDATQTVTISDGAKVTGNINLGGGTDLLEIGQDSTFKGSCSNVENIWIELSASNRKQAAWDIMDSDNATAVDLRIDFDYGLTGKFIICTKESDMAWSDAIQNQIDLSFGADDVVEYSLLGGIFTDSFYNFEIEFKGNKMLLNVTEK